MLEEAGLSPDESALLVALLGSRAATSSELREVVANPEPVLQALCARGLAVRDGPDNFRATDPTLLLRTAVASAEARVERLRQVALDLQNLYRAAQSERLPLDVVEYLPGGEATVVRLDGMIESAERRVGALNPAPWITAPESGGYTGKSAEFAALARGVDIRVIYERASVDEPGRLEDLLESADRGERSRVLPSVPCWLFLIDEVAAIPITETRRFKDGGLLVRGGPLLITLQEWFEALWARAIPLDALVDDPGATEFTAGERALLGLLASGLTDKAIARQLGVSDRTAQRRVAAIIQRLGALTRFQAGLQAARRGLF